MEEEEGAMVEVRVEAVCLPLERQAEDINFLQSQEVPLLPPGDAGPEQGSPLPL